MGELADKLNAALRSAARQTEILNEIARRKRMHYTQSPGPVEGREEFIRANAVMLVEEKEAKIARLRERVAKLENTARCLRAERDKLRALNESLCERVAAQSELLSKKAEKPPP